MMVLIRERLACFLWNLVLLQRIVHVYYNRYMLVPPPPPKILHDIYLRFLSHKKKIVGYELSSVLLHTNKILNQERQTLRNNSHMMRWCSLRVRECVSIIYAGFLKVSPLNKKNKHGPKMLI